MTKDDWAFFKAELEHFAVIHGKTLTKPLATAYWDDLKAMSREDFETACRRLRASAQWFPKPREFLDMGAPVWM